MTVTKTSVILMLIFCGSLILNAVLAIVSLAQARRLQKLAKYEKTLVEVRKYTDSL